MKSKLDSTKLRMLHEAIDRQVLMQEDQIIGTANKIMFRRVHAGMMHAIIDMVAELELKSDDIESAIGSAIANMINCYVSGTTSKMDMKTARGVVLDIMDDAWSGLTFLVDRTFVREATDADPIH